MFCSFDLTSTSACLRGISSNAATANDVTSRGSATPAFWHMAYILAALTSCSLNLRTLVLLPFASPAILSSPRTSISVACQRLARLPVFTHASFQASQRRATVNVHLFLALLDP